MDLGNIIIDSVATCNVMDSSSWDILKKMGVKCRSSKSDKKLFAYGQIEPACLLKIIPIALICIIQISIALSIIITGRRSWSWKSLLEIFDFVMIPFSVKSGQFE